MDFILIAPVLLCSVVVHEVAHAWQALREGDTTARDLGRISLNPLRHLDLVGSLVVPLILYLLPANILFGWAKPVPVNPANYRSYRAGDIRVSLAGIVSNLLLAAISAAALVLMFRAGGGAVVESGAGSTVAELLTYGVLVNLILAFFNLIPVPPLDGSHVLKHALPRRLAALYLRAGRYGVLILVLIAMIFPAVLPAVFAPVLAVFEWVLSLAAG